MSQDNQSIMTIQDYISSPDLLKEEMSIVVDSEATDSVNVVEGRRDDVMEGVIIQSESAVQSDDSSDVIQS